MKSKSGIDFDKILNSEMSFEEFEDNLLETTQEKAAIQSAVDAVTLKIKTPKGFVNVIDACSQVGISSLGYECSFEILDYISKFCNKYKIPPLTAGQDFYNNFQLYLAKKLRRIFPHAKSQVFFSNSGTEAIEAAIKLAQNYKKGRTYISFEGAFHGRTTGSLSLTCSKNVQRRDYLLISAEHAKYAECSNCHRRLNPLDCNAECIDSLEGILRTRDSRDITALFIEPIQGEGGYNVPAPKFVQRVAELCKDNNIPLVDDEVQAAFRTGKYWAIEHFNVKPDMIAVAKSLSGGVIPIGATICHKKFSYDEHGRHANTFGGSEISCMAGICTLNLIENLKVENRGLLENCTYQGNYILKRLREELCDNPYVKLIDGIGLMIGIKYQDKNIRNAVLEKMKCKGVLTLGCGVSSIRLCPPMVINTEISEKIADAVINSTKESGI